jgi:peptide/nickel transport system substrate-binding protein
LIARDEWVARGEGSLKTWETRLHYLEFQYREVPNWQPAVADVRVRRAMTHAVDRPALAEAITHGLGTAAEYFVTRQDPIYPEVERTAARYPYDPNRARALLAEAGWRGSGTAPATNASGQTLDAEVSATGRLESAATIVADYWKAAGMNASLLVIPPARERDREYRASFRSTFVGERTISTDNFYWTSSQIPSAATRFAELNRGGFSDAEIDRLYNQAVSSFDASEQQRAAIAIHRRIADVAAYLPLMYPVEIILARRTVAGPIGNYGPQTGVTWNVWDWSVVS